MADQRQRTLKIDYFGSLTWSNFLDWLVTFILGGIVILTTLQLGSVRPDAQIVVLPLYLCALVLHGLWFVLNRERPLCISAVPLFFLPFLIWAWLNVELISPTPWRGERELVALFGAWVFLWVAVNNVRSRSQLWALVILGLSPACLAILNGYYQFFQQPTSLLDQALSYPVLLDESFLGRSTGAFVDPESFATYLLVLLPAFVVSGLVPRLPIILRVFSFYAAVVLAAAVAFSQTYWALAVVFLLGAAIPWLCFRRRKLQVNMMVANVLVLALVSTFIYFTSSVFRRSFDDAISTDGEGVRLKLWGEVIGSFLESPLWGFGGGAYSFHLEHSDSLALASLPETPYNDYLLVLGQYGIIGFALLGAPILFILVRAIGRWRQEPYLKNSIKRDRALMPLPRFFLTIGLMAFLGFGSAAFFSFPFYVPALLLLGVLVLSILIKHSIPRQIEFGDVPFLRTLYFLFCVGLGFGYVSYASPLLQSQALEMSASQQLEQVVAMDAAIAGSYETLDEVIELYRQTLKVDPHNGDAWVGLGVALLQTHYRDPSAFRETSAQALDAFNSAYEACPDYWLVVANLGTAHALGGDVEEAGEMFQLAVEMAPNSSNANYYFAAFLSLSEQDRERAIEYVSRALEIDPENASARELQQRLLIL